MAKLSLTTTDFENLNKLETSANECEALAKQPHLTTAQQAEYLTMCMRFWELWNERYASMFGIDLSEVAA